MRFGIRGEDDDTSSSVRRNETGKFAPEAKIGYDHNANISRNEKKTHNLYTQASFRAKHRLQIGCSPPHLTLRRRQGSHEKALFLVALAELVVVALLCPLPLPFPLEADRGAVDILTGWSNGALPRRSCKATALRKQHWVGKCRSAEPVGKA